MKILYAIQGTGNGHISRARAIIPALCEKGQVDVLLSGTQADVSLDYPVRYRMQGLGFIFGKSGGIDLLATYRRNKLRRFKDEINSLPVWDYDLVISDFEPVSAWACLRSGKRCIGLSHQSAVLHEKSPQPGHKDRVGIAFLNYYTPVTRQYGFHFQAYDDDIFTPVIRDGVRSAATTEGDHYTVYLPAYSDERIRVVLSQFSEVRWEVFSKHADGIAETRSLFIRPISDGNFLHSMATAKGILCGAGFETPAEALFLKKKLMVVPMKGQYEQQCNAAALEAMGVPVLKSLNLRYTALIDSWLDDPGFVAVDYPDNTRVVIDKLLQDFEATRQSEAAPDTGQKRKGFKKAAFQKIVAAYLSA